MERGFIPSCRSTARSRDLLHGSRIPGALGHPGRRRLVIEVARGAVHLHKISVTGDFGPTIEVSDSVKRETKIILKPRVDLNAAGFRPAPK